MENKSDNNKNQIVCLTNQLLNTIKINTFNCIINHNDLIEIINNNLQLIDLNEVLYYCIKTYYNYDLIDKNMAPNENQIYILWNDGEITAEKGGNVFGHRTPFTKASSFHIKNKYDFPYERNGYTGIIAKLEYCYIMRAIMLILNK